MRNRNILLDNGDVLQATHGLLCQLMDSIGHHNPEVMNYMGMMPVLWAITIFQPQDLQHMVEAFNFPWLSANIVDKRTGLPYLNPYTVINQARDKNRVMGLQTLVTKWLSPSLWPNMQFVDMVDAAKMWMDSIRIKENPQVIIGLFHSGHNAAYEDSDPDAPLNENASLLVGQQVPGFDALFIGHDHERMVKKIVNCHNDSVLVVDPGSQATHISDVTIKVSLDKNNKVIKNLLTELLFPCRG